MLQKLLDFSIIAASVLSLSGCGLGNRAYGTTWSADLEQVPDMSCAREAIAAMDQVWKVEPDDSAIGVFLKSPGRSEAQMQEMNDKTEAGMKKAGYERYKVLPDIMMHFVQAGGKPAFRMSYMGWLRPTDYREIAARAIIAQVAATCHVPNLADRATETRDSIAAPYLFGI